MRMARLVGSVILVVGLGVGFVMAQADARQQPQYFRVLGPTTTVITSWTADGNLSWSNAMPATTCRVQIASSLSHASNWQDYVTVAATGAMTRTQLFSHTTPTGMTYVPAGSFQMGTGTGETYYAHAVSVGGFYMDRTEVTGEQWREVYDWALTNGYDFSNTGGVKGVCHPVHTVNWYDALRWANARSQMEGLTPCYTVGGLTYRQGEDTNAECNWSANGYRLPTEAEWEKAARGGLDGQRFPWGGTTISHRQANYSAACNLGYDLSSLAGYHPLYRVAESPYTSPVGQFAPNGYGLFDMAGNVSEWCWDWYAKGYYGMSPTSDPHGPVSGLFRMRRGGSWASLPYHCFVTDRDMFEYFSFFPDDEDPFLGLRLVRIAAP